MNTTANQNIAAAAIGDRVDSGLGPKNPTIGQDRRAPLPHAIVGIDVDTPQVSPKNRNKKNPLPTPAVPEAAVRDSRIGGTVALLCAAAISAQTLFALGRLIGLSAWTAWLLPAALDVYAMTSTRVAFQVPVGHEARNKAIWNARIALFFTISSNCLYHAMHLAAGHNRWTPADWALVGVSALPPIVVERLLHLQSIVNTGGANTEAAMDDRKASTPSSGSVERKPAPEARASNPLPSAPTTESGSASSKPRPAAGNGSAHPNRHAASGPIPIQRDARLKMIRGWIDDAGGDKKSVPLKVIEERFGVSQATASRMRDEAVAPAKRTATDGGDQRVDEEPEQALEAIS